MSFAFNATISAAITLLVLITVIMSEALLGKADYIQSGNEVLASVIKSGAAEAEQAA